MSIRIIVDSTCDLPEELINEHKIEIVSLGIQIEEDTFLDGVTIKTEDVYTHMRKGKYPKTSAVNPETFKALFRKNLKKNNDVIYIGFSSKLSTTFQNALMAAEEIKYDYIENSIFCVDSKTGALGTGLLVLQALRLIKEKYPITVIQRKLTYFVNHLHGIFTVDDIQWLYQGGRISKGKAILGTALKIKPIIEVKNGEMIPIHTVRGIKRAYKYMIDYIQDKIGTFTNQIIGISHAADIDYAHMFKEMMESHTGCKKYITQLIGGVLGVHLGIGGVGVFFFGEEEIDNISYKGIMEI
ncbi:MAG: DegV family protein [Eubacteriales bacterium]